jgi:hypothetical protein
MPITSKPASKDYRDNFEATFGKEDTQEQVIDPAAVAVNFICDEEFGEGAVSKENPCDATREGFRCHRLKNHGGMHEGTDDSGAELVWSALFTTSL